MRTAEEYKKLSIQEFTKAAQSYDSDNAGIYEMCEKAGLTVEKLETQKGHRLHLVARKKS